MSTVNNETEISTVIFLYQIGDYSFTKINRTNFILQSIETPFIVSVFVVVRNT